MLEPVIDRIQALLPAERAILVGLSGIDASGKGYVTRQLELALRERGIRVANINIDGWLNPPAIRFDDLQPAETFYAKGLRLDQMFEELVLPLKAARSIVLNARLVRELDAVYSRVVADLEGMKKAYARTATSASSNLPEADHE